MKHLKFIIALVIFLSPFASSSALHRGPALYPWDGGDILGVALEPSGSQKLQDVIGNLERLVRYKRFDPHLLDGPERPEGLDPDWTLLDDGLSRTLIHFYSSNDSERSIAFLRDIYGVFTRSLESMASITHDYPEFEVLGALHNPTFWGNPEGHDQVKRIFRDTEELQGLIDCARALQAVAKAIEEKSIRLTIDDADEERAKKAEESARIRALKQGVRASFEGIPTLLDIAYSSFMRSIAEEVGALNAAVSAFDSSTHEGRLSMVRTLMATGESLKLLPRELREKEGPKQCISFRDKLAKVIVVRRGDIESLDAGVFARVPEFMDFLLKDLNATMAGETPIDREMFADATAIDSIRGSLGYRRNWKRQAGATFPDPPEINVDFLRDLVGEMKALAGDVKTLEWDAAFNAVSPLLYSCHGVIFSVQEFLKGRALSLREEARRRHDAAGARGGIEDTSTIPLTEEAKVLEEKAENLKKTWDNVLFNMPIVPGESFEALLVRASEWIQGFRGRLIGDGILTEEEADGFDGSSATIDWGPLLTFELNPMDIIRGRLVYHNCCGNLSEIMIKQLVCMNKGVEGLGAADPLTQARLRTLGYVLTQAVIEDGDFPDLADWVPNFRKLRHFWAHPAPEREFPGDLVQPMSMGSVWANESRALVGIMVGFGHVLSHI